MMPVHPSPDLLRQQRLVGAMLESGYFPCPARVEETHISWVLLAGCDAYKIKKSLDLGFLDFSTLEARRFYCTEELRLNRRLAPDLYLDIVTIGGSPEQPVLHGEPAIEYAVHMRRFERSAMLDQLLAQGRVTAAHIDRLAATIANFHAALPPAAADSQFGSPAAIQAAVLQNFTQLSSLFTTPDDLAMLESLRDASMLEFGACEQLFHQRKQAGSVRECHGDLHLGNIVLIDDVPVPFDGIEFNAALRWIDVISEIAFTVMDLLHRGQPQLAWRFLNAYLENTGDYAGIGVLRFYLAYRAMVRAKVAAIRAHQEDTAQAEQDRAECYAYLSLAHDCLTHRHPVLIITHGLPGCGKSTFAQIVLERMGAIRIRSDVERKRLFGLAALADSRSQTGVDIYGKYATHRTYAHLLELARNLLMAGFPVIVDAAFLHHAERTQFQALAEELDAPFIIASLHAEEPLLAERLAKRLSRADDASEADIAVMQALQANQELPEDEELAATVRFANNGDADALRTAIEKWISHDARLTQLVG